MNPTVLLAALPGLLAPQAPQPTATKPAAQEAAPSLEEELAYLALSSAATADNLRTGAATPEIRNRLGRAYTRYVLIALDFRPEAFAAKNLDLKSGLGAPPRKPITEVPELIEKPPFAKYAESYAKKHPRVPHPVADLAPGKDTVVQVLSAFGTPASEDWDETGGVTYAFSAPAGPVQCRIDRAKVLEELKLPAPKP